MTRTVIKTDNQLLATDSRVWPMLADARVTLVEVPCVTEADLIEHCQGADILAVIKEPLTAQVLERLPRCRAIVKLGIGVNAIDLEAASRLGIQVANVPDASYVEVGSHAVAMMLALVRGLNRFDRDVRRGIWDGPRSGNGIRRIDTMTVGVVGLGRTGQYLATMSNALAMRVLGHDPNLSPDTIRSRGAEPTSLDELIARSDIVTLHVPLTDETRNLMSLERLLSMRPGSYLINVARGQLVNEEALVDVLRSGHLAGAGLDAFATEPLPAGHYLLESERVILSPHAAYYSVDSIYEVQRRGFAEIISILDGRAPTFPVNHVDNPRTASLG